jgi:hypothetical protein
MTQMRSGILTVTGLVSLTVFAMSSLFTMACEDNTLKYVPHSAYSGAVKPDLPAVPALPPPEAYKKGDVWTVMGLQHHLNSPNHVKEVDGKMLSAEGFVVKVYTPDEPKEYAGCINPIKGRAPTAKEPFPKEKKCEDIISTTEPPHFWIADNANEKSEAKMIAVYGYYSSAIQAYIGREEYKTKNRLDKLLTLKCDSEMYSDNNYGACIYIFGEPKVGAKVKIKGKFAITFNAGTTSNAVSPFGIFDVTMKPNVVEHGFIDVDPAQVDNIALR